MTAETPFKVGTPVTYENTEARHRDVRQAIVAKVGRKWVYIGGDNLPWYIADKAFDKDTGQCKSDYRGTSRERIETAEMRAARERRETAVVELHAAWPNTTDRVPTRGLTIDQIERITAILTEETNQ